MAIFSNIQIQLLILHKKSKFIFLKNFSPFIITNEFMIVPYFIDPISRNNVSKSSFNFKQIQEMFSSIHKLLVNNNTKIKDLYKYFFNE